MDDAAGYFPPAPGSHFPYYAPSPVLSPSSHGEVRTLFVAGLPVDVKPREIYNLFREFPGYESSHLRKSSESSQPFAFAVFLAQHFAIAAMHALNGMVFDLEKGSTLYIDLAKSNSRAKRQRADDGRFGYDKRAKGSNDSGIGSTHTPGIENFAYNITAYPSAPSTTMPFRRGNLDASALNETTASHSQHSPQINAPCSTLFVANLGLACTEHELIQTFSRCPGFTKLKMQETTYGALVAFVDFQDTVSSTGALSHLQGTRLFSSTGEGMRLSYARSRMGTRKPVKLIKGNQNFGC